MFTVDANYQIQQPLAQFFASQLINLDWVQPGNGEHLMFPAQSDVADGAGHALVTAYALRRPDGQWSVMMVNKDQENAHRVRIAFQAQRGLGQPDRGQPDLGQVDKNPPALSPESFVGPVEISSFGKDQYQWHPGSTRFMAHAEHAGEHAVVANTKGTADPDGPVVHSKQNAGKETAYDLPAASIVVIRGKIGAR
jgi:hypothetical protein